MQLAARRSKGSCQSNSARVMTSASRSRATNAHCSEAAAKRPLRACYLLRRLPHPEGEQSCPPNGGSTIAAKRCCTPQRTDAIRNQVKPDIESHPDATKGNYSQLPSGHRGSSHQTGHNLRP